MKSNRTMHPMGHEDEADVRRSEVQELLRCVASHASHTHLSQPALGAPAAGQAGRLWCCRKYLLGKRALGAGTFRRRLGRRRHPMAIGGTPPLAPNKILCSGLARLKTSP